MLTLPRFEWREPADLAGLLAHLAAHGGESLLVAGGTDAVPNLKHRLREPRWVVSLRRLEELRFARDEDDGLHLGALLTLSELARLDAVRRDFPALAKAAGLVAGPQLRNMGTLGGNLCLDTRCTYYNQTFFWRQALGFCLKKDGQTCHVVPAGRRCVAAHSSDVAPVLIALGATVEIAGLDAAGAVARRTLPVDGFFVADGVHNNVLQPHEVVTRVVLPAAARGLAGGYQKLRLRNSIDFPMLSVAFAARLRDGRCEEANLVLGALAARPKVVAGVTGLVRGRPLDEEAGEVLARAAARQCRPLPNLPYDEDWRHAMVPVCVKRAVREAAGRAPGGED